MDKQPVGQLPDLTQSNNDDEIMVITNDEYNQLKKEKISDFITDLTSTNENNALTKGTDGKMFVTDFGNASNITEGTLPTSVLPEIPLEKIPDIPKDKLPSIETSDLPVSGVTAGTYTYPTDIVVNSKGQVTSITEGQAGANNANQDLSNLGPLGLDKINQSKALETGSISSDADVYADVLKYKNSGTGTGIDTIKPDEYTVTGTPSISETGIASNLGNGNKIQCNTFTLADLKNKSWKAECEINVVDLNTSDTADISTYLLKFCDNWYTYGSITCFYNNETNRFSFRLNTRVDDIEGWYCYTTIPVLTEDIKRLKIIATFEKDAETQNYKTKVFNADTGEQLGNTGSYTPATDKKELDIIDDLPTQSPLLGEGATPQNWTTYDLNTYKFYIEDELVWQPCLKIPYTLSKTGSKIVDAAYRDRVQDVYEQYGTAMYYTLDEENQNFTLPMGDIYGMITKNREILDIVYPIGRPMPEENNVLLDNEVWLEGATVNPIDYPKLFKVYGTKYGGDGTTTFKLPDLRNRVLWGSSDGSNGYIESKLPNIKGNVHLEGDSGSHAKQTSTASGAFNWINPGTGAAFENTGGGLPWFSDFNFDASRSNSIYSDSAKIVQPPAFKVRWKTRFE